jgi:hypothetical protein
LDDTARMDILARDLTPSDRSLRRVFDNLRAVDLVPRDAEYDRARFSEDSFLKAIAN